MAAMATRIETEAGQRLTPEESIKLSKGHYEEHTATLDKTGTKERPVENAPAEHNGQ